MHEPSDTRPSGLILLSQPEERGITPEEMFSALPESYQRLPHRVVELDMAATARQAVRSCDWGAAQRELEERFRRDLAPLREKYPGYRIVYFGSSPIPLTVHLGFLLETWQGIEVIPHHHMQRVWKWISEPGAPTARLAPVVLPGEKDRSPGEAVIRVSTSHRVDPQVTQRVIPEPLVEIDIALEHPGEDVFTRLEEMQEVAHRFREALDCIGDRFAGVQRVHLFASVQPGMALLLGAQISKTMHPPVQTYQYARGEGDGPLHVPALLVNGPRRPAPPPLSAEEQDRATADRKRLEEDLERMRGLALDMQANPGQSWITGLLPRPGGHPAFSGHWLHLPPLDRTPLWRSSVDLETRTVADSFRLDHSREAWQLDDHWLARLARRLPEEARRARALRLLMLHELAHRGPQALTSESSRGIGRFPKVLEEIDYHADVWAMLHEYVLTKRQAPREASDVGRFFTDLVRIATETMWAFNDEDVPLRELQVRRLHRYLIWYWQYLLLERQGSQAGEPLDPVLLCLAQRPLIELAGPEVRSREERVFFALDSAHVHVPELAVYHEGRLFRHGTRLDFSIAELLDGARECNGEKILGALRAAFQQTVR